MARYRVDTELEVGDRKITDRVTARDDKHLERIRGKARENAPLGSTLKIKATRTS